MSPAAGAGGDPLDMLTQYQRSAIVGTAVETGVADAIAHGPRDAAGVAAELGTHPDATARLLSALVALGLAELGDDGFALSAAGSSLGSDAADSIAEIVRKEWFFYRTWATLPQAIADGHARIATWRDRLRDDPAQSLAFLRALDDLAARFGAGLPELAGLETGGRLLDVGGGAGSHSAYLEAAVDGLEATVLDLAEAEEVLRERHPELAFVTGDFDAPRFGRPEGEEWDYVLLANILHDHPPQRCAELVAESAGLLAPGGSLVIYEWVINEDRISPPDVALFALMMLVENEGGGTWTEAQIAGWSRDAGLEPGALQRNPGPISALVARKPEASEGSTE
jgi:3-hydroxy-5-methyl-1-naphthoate 3-O-methyltransferase